MNRDLAQEAIQQALKGNWVKAITLNKKLLEENIKDVDALNRLARAYCETGKVVLAKRTAQKALKIDPFNNISAKTLEKLKSLKKGDSYVCAPADAQNFLEEPGKTKIIQLLHAGDEKLLVRLDSGDEVFLNHSSHKLSVTTKDGKYIGRLPDDISARLRTLIKHGNSYRVCIKSINKKVVKVFIRETKRAENLSDIPSFTSEKIDYVSFTPPELVHRKDESSNSSSDEEEEE